MNRHPQSMAYDVFLDPVVQLAALCPICALAVLRPTAALAALSPVLRLLNPAINPRAALLAFSLPATAQVHATLHARQHTTANSLNLMKNWQDCGILRANLSQVFMSPNKRDY